MRVGEFCNRNVVTIDRTASVVDAAALMRQHHVGDLVIVNDDNEGAVPVAILTDRDIVVETVALKLENLEQLAAADLAVSELVTINENDSLFQAIEKMRSNVIRRMPVVNEDGGLIGIITFDDMVDLLVEQMNGLSAISVRQQRKEAERRP